MQPLRLNQDGREWPLRPLRRDAARVYLSLGHLALQFSMVLTLCSKRQSRESNVTSFFPLKTFFDDKTDSTLYFLNVLRWTRPTCCFTKFPIVVLKLWTYVLKIPDYSSEIMGVCFQNSRLWF